MSSAPACVIVVGSVNNDLSMHVRWLPRPGETVTGGAHTESGGGKGANQAFAAAQLGARVHLIARVGEDAAGLRARTDLSAVGVDTTKVLSTPGCSTGLAVVLVDDASENCISVSPGANSALSVDDVTSALRALSAEEGSVLVTGLEIPPESAAAALRVAKARGWRTVLNPAPAHKLPTTMLADVDVLTPNEHEADVLGMSVSELIASGVGAVVTTRGSAGVSISSRDGSLSTMPAFQVPAVDTTGAGDVFTGALAQAMARRDDLVDAVRWACAAAALATLGRGARCQRLHSTQVDQLLACPPE